MIGVNDWDRRKEQYELFWQKRNDKPLLAATAMVNNRSTAAIPDIETKWFDDKWFVQNARKQFQNTYFGGVSFPHVMPSLGPDLLCGILGSELNFDENTSWAVHSDRPLADYYGQKLDEQNHYYKLMSRFLENYTEDAKDGSYLVGMVDLNTMVDGVSSLIGPERLCMELMDYPEETAHIIKENVSLYKPVFDHFYKISTRYQKGTTNWLSVYSETPSYFISVDFMVMISDSAFMEFIDEPLRDLAAYHDRVFLHLDGENAVRHLNRILAIKDIDAVQVQATPLVHTARLWIPYINRIQEAGKNVHIEAKTLQDVITLKEKCAPEGLFIKMPCESLEVAKRAEEIIYG